MSSRPLAKSTTRRNFQIVKDNYTEMSDAELIIASKRHDEAALAQLLSRYEHIIAGMFYKRAPDWKDTSDLVQEVMIRVWRSIDQIRSPHSFKSWLNRIVTNIFYDELRKRPRGLQIVSIDEPLTVDGDTTRHTMEIVDNSQAPETKVLESELAEVLVKAMAKIPANFRRAAILRDVDGLSYEAIAAQTDTELGTVKSRIARARVKLQKHLRNYLRECA